MALSLKGISFPIAETIEPVRLAITTTRRDVVDSAVNAHHYGNSINIDRFLTFSIVALTLLSAIPVLRASQTTGIILLIIAGPALAFAFIYRRFCQDIIHAQAAGLDQEISLINDQIKGAGCALSALQKQTSTIQEAVARDESRITEVRVKLDAEEQRELTTHLRETESTASVFSDRLRALRDSHHRELRALQTKTAKELLALEYKRKSLIHAEELEIAEHLRAKQHKYIIKQLHRLGGSTGGTLKAPQGAKRAATTAAAAVVAAPHSSGQRGVAFTLAAPLAETIETMMRDVESLFALGLALELQDSAHAPIDLSDRETAAVKGKYQEQHQQIREHREAVEGGLLEAEAPLRIKFEQEQQILNKEVQKAEALSSEVVQSVRGAYNLKHSVLANILKTLGQTRAARIEKLDHQVKELRASLLLLNDERELFEGKRKALGSPHLSSYLIRLI